MNKKAILQLLVCFVFGYLLISSNIFAFNAYKNSPFYYDEIIDFGISNIDTQNISYLQLTIFSDHETFLDLDYSIDDAKNIPLTFDKSTPSLLSVKYLFFDEKDQIVDENFFAINLLDQNNTDIYLSYSKDCNLENTPNNYDFWFDDSFYLCLITNDFDKFTYDVLIESNGKSLVSEKNIELPFIIPNNLIRGYENYSINIEVTDKDTKKKILKKISFNLSELTKQEHENLMKYMTNFEDINNTVINNEKQKESEYKEQEDINIDSEGNNISESKKKLNFIPILAMFFAIFLILIILISNKKNKTVNRRIKRKNL